MPFVAVVVIFRSNIQTHGIMAQFPWPTLPVIKYGADSTIPVSYIAMLR